ncbi:MAG: hypothetical protein KatS3mg102_1561 [Planctomycetota bacterium]|nr:MAG: hypothetical protein KatS3mg102_1561 [Planctomycetota bacterium]
MATAQKSAGDSRAAVKRQAEGADALVARGRALEAEGAYQEAQAAYEQALQRDPAHPEALFRLAYHHELRGSIEQALGYYERLAEMEQPYEGALLNYGLLLEDEGRYEEALEVYRRVLRARPGHRRARMFYQDAEASLEMYYDEEQARRSDRRNAILRIPITDFELSVRARNCLNKMEIRTLGDLVVKTEEELLSYKNFGETSLQEIKQLLAQKGLKLGMFRDEPGALSPAALPAAPAAPPADAVTELLGRPIAELGLSVRARNCMERLGIRTIGELVDKSETELLGVKNFGQTSLQEVKQKLAAHGLSLRQD